MSKVKHTHPEQRLFSNVAKLIKQSKQLKTSGTFVTRGTVVQVHYSQNISIMEENNKNTEGFIPKHGGY